MRNVCCDVNGRNLIAAVHVAEYGDEAAVDVVVVMRERWRRRRTAARVDEKKEGWDGRLGGREGNRPRFRSLRRR